ncbi:Peptidoglycan/LPS O-acetylase OafA/YrhL, contains acyltransferase and SGNH-hydrolase domains [Microbulbifer donghaiensis]|uniref:Peptidoglycan/LPS O-acetylase OafA/YrhL, contains acyltransferase and SGNH-hydrolase domains n=1 Tax=Microbulbifer donghaiensis TaxID=494016 RepID=A0A1M4XFW2_9GAMM|nr:acyltransferase family protein [Microbulbifer donghaiensis]SHE92415.1 Peptidoglycan/LPS O-acetylase OafA/YrhL, contains acyltransferase and SGNH-hydrolase domains [Microbulbifer donghaiensis]
MKIDLPMRYRADIDGLRSVAVLLVLVFHFKILDLGKAGFLGVDIFFVISGYLITKILYTQALNNHGKIDFAKFYLARIRRLAPALFATLALTLIAGYFLLLPEHFSSLAKEVIFTQVYASNIYYWQTINYFGLQADSAILLHTWSLAVEEQFYLFFPLFIFALFLFFRRHFWSAFALAGACSFLLNIYFVNVKPEATFYLMPTRAWEFIVGGLIVFFAQRRKAITAFESETCAVAGAIVIAAAVIFYSENVQFPGYYALLPTIGTALVIYAGTCQGSSITRLLSTRLPVYIGKLSYSLYLVHWPINIFAAYQLGADYTVEWRITFFLLTFLISIMMFHWVEHPTRKVSIETHPQRVAWGYVTGLACTIIFSATVLTQNGLPSRLTDTARQLANYSSDTPPDMPECQPDATSELRREDFCQVGDAAQDPSWIMLGDSHAWALKRAFDIWLKGRGESGLFIFRHSCPPLVGLSLFKEKGRCRQFNERAYAYIYTDKSIRNVVLASTWIQARRALTLDSDRKAEPGESLAIFSSAFTQSIDTLHSKGKHIYIWGPVPGAKGNVPLRLAKAANPETEAENLAFTFSEYQQRYDFFYDAVEFSKKKISGIINPSRELCRNGEVCRVTINNLPAYSDGDHLAYSWSNYWANVIEDQLSGKL